MQGSLVTQNRLRFDFNLHRGLKEDELARVEELVNGWVAADTALVTKEMPLAEAKAAGERSALDTTSLRALLPDVISSLSDNETCPIFYGKIVLRWNLSRENGSF